MLIVSLILGAYAASYPLLTSALAALDSRHIYTSNSSSEDTLSPPSQALNASETKMESFEYYLQSGFEDIARFPTRIQLTSIEVHPFTPDRAGAASADVAKFVGMRLNFVDQHGGSWLTYNWNTDRVRDLVNWSPISGTPSYRRSRGYQSFPVGPLPMTMRQAFQKLQNAQWTDKWEAIVIAKFKKTPPGHRDELFFAFRSSSLPKPSNWVYVGAQSGSVLQDEDPEVISVRLSDNASTWTERR